MTRAPSSASWRVQNGAAIACSRVTTVMPRRGCMSEGLRQSQHVLGDVAEDQVGRDRSDLVQPRLAELALDVVFAREAEAAVHLQAHVGRLPARLGGQVLGHVGLGAAGL